MYSKLRLNYIDTAQELYDQWTKLSHKEKNIEYAKWVEGEITNGHYIIELGQYGVQDTYKIPDYLLLKGSDECWNAILKDWDKRNRKQDINGGTKCLTININVQPNMGT
ncbi:hypothetical protein [Paenibacillus donghaensis]|uniref:Uncharacterized protein n=1 Tax=Paenibacillus donghaensis TaxID=414771 RepID=A0A2Z2KQI6_9BACL|nr:hypothetical protein [Paenibacillus donghaensis]ASA22591.1 hypothetical protein B9T62_18465 [Paenibacillus donghaensis]